MAARGGDVVEGNPFVRRRRIRRAPDGARGRRPPPGRERDPDHSPPPRHSARYIVPLRIEEYALIGDCETAALVGRDGSIDWLCLPRFDSDGCFAKLVGSEDNGFWRLAPMKPREVERRYQPGTLILDTIFTAKGGRVRVTDFMPPKSDHSRIVRIIEGLEGRVEMQCEIAVRFEYGKSIPWVSRLNGAAISMVAGASMLVLGTDAPLRGKGMRTVGRFTMSKGADLSGFVPG